MPAPERFIEAVTRPFAKRNAELHLTARSFLSKACENGSLVRPECLNAATQRLESKSPRRWFADWKILFSLLAAVSAIIGLGLGSKAIFLTRKALRMEPARSLVEVTASLSPDEKLLLHGDTTKFGADRYKALWDSEPDNPAYFADYALRHVREHDDLPPDFLETAERLDPDNSWFVILAAGVEAKGAISLKSRRRSTYRIDDAEGFERALNLLHQAADCSRFDSYQGALSSERIALLPERTDFADQFLPVGYVAGLPSSSLEMRYVATAAKLQADRLAASKDAGAFHQLLDGYTDWLRQFATAPKVAIVDALVLRACLTSPSKDFAEVAEQLGLAQEAEFWLSIHEWSEREKIRREALKEGSDISSRSGFLAGLGLSVTSRQVENGPQLTEQDLKPSRLMEHELLSRILAAAGGQLLALILLATALYRFRFSPLHRHLSHSLERLLTPLDHLWIMTAGVLLPFAFYLGIYRLTPLGGRNWSISASQFIVPTGQFTAMLVLVISLSVIVCRHRLRVRGLEMKRSRLLWLLVAGSAMAIPLFGASFFANGQGNNLSLGVAGLVGVLLLVLLCRAIAAFSDRKPNTIQKLLVAGNLLPAYSLAILLMTASIPIYHTLEKRWMARDHLTEITPEAPAMSRYEFEVAQAVQAEVRQLLATD